MRLFIFKINDIGTLWRSTSAASKASASNSISYAVSNSQRRMGCGRGGLPTASAQILGVADDVVDAHGVRLRDHEPIAHVLVGLEQEQGPGSLIRQAYARP
jgi:hypothetical protein